MGVQTLSLSLSAADTAESGASTASDQSPPPPPQPLFRCSAAAAAAATSAVVDPSHDSEEESSSPPARLPSSSRYKGVVPQPNGRWGAQIYERHARVWLGTFHDEETAAAAYDVAARRFRGRAAAVNFLGRPPPSAAELAFLAAHSKNEIVDMLRKHTYSDELKQSIRRGRDAAGGGNAAAKVPPWARERLFEKAVTPSDVGKLNRLVVPKQQAEKHFPLKCDGRGVLLNFEDEAGKVWRFRYSYWNSSQSYVLTKGWSRFVRDKGLQAGDAVAFFRAMCGGERQLYIECRRRAEAKASNTGTSGSSTKQVDAGDNGDAVVRLFGVDIIAVGKKRAAAAPCCHEQEQSKKKQCVAVPATALGAAL